MDESAYLELDGLAVVTMTITIISVVVNIVQGYAQWRSSRDRKRLSAPVQNAVVGLLNQTKQATNSLYQAQQLLWSPMWPHRDLATSRWEFNHLLNAAMAQTQGLQEAVVAIYRSIAPDDPEGRQAFAAAEFGLTKEEKEARKKRLEELLSQQRQPSGSAAQLALDTDVRAETDNASPPPASTDRS